ncbi:hypothetical protein EI94DRAFT_1723680 [Lactarius quietus]|nr:hypothetical protein EI94DRAFT_1723680 [Lactarius quietus]
MAHFFPAASRMDVEPPSLRRTPTGGVSDDASSEGRLSRPSHINWLQSSLAATAQAGIPMPKRPLSARLGRSASLSAIPAPPPLRQQPSNLSNHSLQLDRLAGCQTDGAKPLSPISEQSYVPTPTSKRDVFPTEVEPPSTPVSVASTYSAFLRRPLKRSISATSTSSLRTNVTSIHPPTLPPINITPLDIRPVYPPVSQRAGFSTVYEDAGSERTGSFVTAPSEADDDDAEDPTSPSARGGAMGFHGPSGSTTLYDSSAFPGGALADPYTDSSDRASDRFTTTPPPSGSGISSDPSGAQAQARPRGGRTTGSGGGSGTSDSFALRRLTFGSALSRPSFTTARRARAAALARLPPLPIILFWAGFVAPWCWLIGGWLIAEGRWEDNGKARPAWPLWRPRSTRRRMDKGKMVLARDVEKGPEGAGAGANEDAPRRRWAWTAWNPFTPRASILLAKLPGTSGDGAAAAQKEKVVTFVKPYSAEVWVYRCRLAAVISAVVLLTALIVTLVIVGGSGQ